MKPLWINTLEIFQYKVRFQEKDWFFDLNYWALLAFCVYVGMYVDSVFFVYVCNLLHDETNLLFIVDSNLPIEKKQFELTIFFTCSLLESFDFCRLSATFSVHISKILLLVHIFCMEHVLSSFCLKRMLFLEF